MKLEATCDRRHTRVETRETTPGVWTDGKAHDFFFTLRSEGREVGNLKLHSGDEAAYQVGAVYSLTISQ